MVLLCWVSDCAAIACYSSLKYAASIYIAAAVAAAAVDIVATVAVHAIVTAAQRNVHSLYGSGLQSLAMNAAIVMDLCNFELYLC